MGVGDQRHTPAVLPPGKTGYPLYRRLGGPQGRSVRVRKISPPPGFEPRTVQPVASRYTDWAIAARDVERGVLKFQEDEEHSGVSKYLRSGTDGRVKELVREYTVH